MVPGGHFLFGAGLEVTTTANMDGDDQTRESAGGRLRNLVLNSLGGRAVAATLLLFLIGAVIAPSTVSPSSILSLLPFVAFLSVAAIGQHLVIQQRGLDISIAAIMSFAAVIVTKLPGSGASSAEVLGYVALALIMGLVAGALNGTIITLLKVPSLVTTIGVNSVIFGITLMVSGSVPSQAAPQFAQFIIGLTLGVPNSIWIALLVAAITLFIIERTSIGRKFIATSVSPRAAHAVAIPVERYKIATYMAAGLCYAIAGVLLAGFLSVPSIFSGNPYILASVASVVVGGNSVAGGARGSIFATIIGAIFLTFLGQLVLSAGMERSMQNVVEAIIVIGGVGLPMLLRRAKAAPITASPTSIAGAKPEAPKNTAMPVLELTGIQKSFGAVQALKGVDFAAYPGEVHAIVGENGAGKSTMIGVAAGVLRADAGSILVKGQAAAEGPRARREQRISVAYQHPELPADLSVYEILRLAAPGITEAAAEESIARIASVQLQMGILQRVEELSLAQRHVVEIARALASNPAVLILDEPTEPFQQKDIEHLFEVIRDLRNQGVAIVYVSHRLHEVTELADRISIMRDGEVVASRRVSEITTNEIVSLIAGRPLTQIFPPKSGAPKEVVLDVQHLSGAGFHDVSLQARAGEIIGLAGIEGEGQRAFLRAVGSIEPASAGSIRVAGADITAKGPVGLRNAGVGFVSDDRHGEGLFLKLSVRENIGIGAIDAISSSGLMDRARERALALSVSEGLRVRSPSIETAVSDLSGGNQQKVLFGREVSVRPKVLLVDEPTKGVDIGARAEIYQQLRKLADEGAAVVVAASDGVELEGLCDRVFVFARGGIVRELTGDDVNDTTITEANLTATASKAASAVKSAARTGWQVLFASDHFPAAILIALTAVILFGTNAVNEFFLSGFNITQMLGLLAILCFIALGQFIAILVGGIDLSVGPLAGLVVVLASFLLPSGSSAGLIVAGAALLLVICIAFGYVQGVLITKLQLPAIVVTLATFIGLQGVSLLLRPRPKGTISNTLSDTFGYAVLGVPAGMILALLAVIAFEWLLYRHAAGRQLRAVGSNMLASHRLGVDNGRVTRIAFATTGLLTGIAGLILAGQIGIGSGTTGVDFSLMSITAVVLGGVSVAGGRGSAICVALGAAMAQATTSASSFLSPDASWYYAVLGTVTLIGASLFSIARWSRRGTGL
jgi:ribose transport system ATP-binding protein